MKLILTREVAGLGTAGDVVTVKDGFARNFLLPGGNAIAWSLGGEKQIQSIRRARSAREIRDIDHAKEVKVKLDENMKPIAIELKERHDTNLLIEDFMLLANEYVAESLLLDHSRTATLAITDDLPVNEFYFMRRWLAMGTTAPTSEGKGPPAAAVPR